MFLSVVPFVPHTRIINKRVVYDDEVLPLKNDDYHLKITSIDGVSESDLERCLIIIFKSNPNVIFSTIQYSKNKKTVYFYTDKEITTKAYEESKSFKYKPITSNSEILEEVKSVLLAKTNKDNHCVSLYDVARLLKQLRYDYDTIKECYEVHLENILRAKYGCYCSIGIYDFDYKNKILKIDFSKSIDDDAEICFSKEKEDLYITRSETIYGNEIFEVLRSDLSNLYDDLANFRDYKEHNKARYDIKAVNSNFTVDISHYGVRIFVKSQKNQLTNTFSLFSPSYDDKYSFECNTNIINEAFKGRETELFKRIFVKISDCPEWCQSMLYELRQNQLEEEQKLEDEKKYQELKKHNKLALAKKFFPFLKK